MQTAKQLDAEETYLAYDALNRVVSKTGARGAIYFIYDANSEQATVKDQSGFVTTHVRDSANRITKTIANNGKTAYFAYDKSGWTHA